MKKTKKQLNNELKNFIVAKILAMKKFFLLIVVVILVVIVVNTPFSLQNVRFLELSTNDIEYVFYSSQSISSPYANVIKNGNACIITTSLSSAPIVKEKISKIDGESFSFNGTMEDFNMIKDFFITNLILEEEIDGMISIYGYNSKLKYSTKIDGKEINIQIVYNNGRVTAGSPVILGSY